MDAPHRLTLDERLYELIPSPVDAFAVREVAADGPITVHRAPALHALPPAVRAWVGAFWARLYAAKSETLAADQWESRYRTTLEGWVYEWSDDRDGQREVLHRVSPAGGERPESRPR